MDHYLDDFIMLGLDAVLESFERLGVPLSVEKLGGPATCLTFLGIEVDTEAMELRLPEKKLGLLTAAIKEWYGPSGVRVARSVSYCR